jgi:hypothetical protein
MEPALLSMRNIQESVDDPRKSAEITVQPADIRLRAKLKR